MLYKKCRNKVVLRIDKGEEIIETISALSSIENIKTANVFGIGAVDNVTIGLFESDKKKYCSKQFKQDFEMTSLLGNITTKDEQVYLHLHINLADIDHHTFGGHLNEAYVSATCEIVIDILDMKIERKFDRETGLNLISV